MEAADKVYMQIKHGVNVIEKEIFEMRNNAYTGNAIGEWIEETIDQIKEKRPLKIEILVTR